MAKKESKTEVKKIDKSILKLNSLANDLIDELKSNIFSTGVEHDKDIKKIRDSIDSIVNSEVTDLKNFTGDDISAFMVKTFNDYDKDIDADISKLNSLEDLFEGDSGNVFTAFNERYRNKALLYEDLEIISSQLVDLAEALNTTRDSIISSDEIGASISRSLTFDNNSMADVDHESYIKTVEVLEKKNKLHNKIKNHIVPKGLKYGTYYTYTIPQKEIFSALYADKMKNVRTMESFVDEEMISYVSENATIIGSDDKTTNLKYKNKTNTKSYLEGIASNIAISNDEIPIPVLESMGIENTSFDISKYVKDTNKEVKPKKGNSLFTMDGVVDSGEDKKAEDFSFVDDVYIKLLNPKNVIPVEIMDFKVGYYYMYGETDNFNPMNSKKTGGRFTSSFNISPENSKLTERDIVLSLTDKIVKSFDKPYLETNIKFKDMILNSLMYEKNYRKKVHFQFIPAQYINEFKVNEDENGNGTSMLMNSLFYAKLYLAILIFNIITYLSKSNDTKIYYVKNSGIDTNVINKTMQIARDVKSKQLNFTDLLNYNSIVSKVGASKEIFMPIGKSGERGIEFDILSGQNVEMQTDLLEMLKQAYLNGTGVPAVLMNYINEADFAKTLVMANAKYMGSVVNYQLDFDESITEWYKKILLFSTDIPPEIINDFRYKLNPPKALGNTNLSDITGYVDTIVDFIIKYMMSENDKGEEGELVKEILRKELAKESAPMLPWDRIEELFKNASLKAKLEFNLSKNNSNSDSSGDGDY